MKLKNPIVVALDLDDAKKAQKLSESLSPYVGGFKLGPRLTFRADKSWLKDLKAAATLFVDHKFFDIPSTTEASVKVAYDLGADWVTVHALNGPECLKKLSQLEKSLRSENPDFKILVVTVLTSFSPETLPPIWKDQSIGQSVEELAKMSASVGLKNFVCSPHEISLLKKISGSFIVTPGVRLGDAKTDDQKRTAAPKEAMQMGANALVIGRPIIEAADPVAAAKNIQSLL